VSSTDRSSIVMSTDHATVLLWSLLSSAHAVDSSVVYCPLFDCHRNRANLMSYIVVSSTVDSFIVVLSSLLLSTIQLSSRQAYFDIIYCHVFHCRVSSTVSSCIVVLDGLQLSCQLLSCLLLSPVFYRSSNCGIFFCPIF